MDEDDKPLTMRLAEEGVDEEIAYEAAAEAEKQRLEAERERIQNKSFGQTFIEETDMAQMIEVLMKNTMKAFAAGQEVQQRQQRPAVSVERRAEPEATSEASDGSAAAPERSPLAEEMEIDDGDS
jgi:hypothetical protein